MFRSISSRFTKRQESFKEGSAKQESLDGVIKEFIETIFGPAARAVDIKATIEGGNLFIQTSNKTAANEIIFHSGALYRFLKERGIIYRQVVIR